jgi:hypothetical protein
MTAGLEGGEWSASRPGRTLPPGKDPVPILLEAGWAPGPVWTGGKTRPNRNSKPDRQTRSSIAILTELPGPEDNIYIYTHSHTYIQSVPGGKVNIRGGHSIGHSKQKCLYEYVSYSERFPR